MSWGNAPHPTPPAHAPRDEAQSEEQGGKRGREANLLPAVSLPKGGGAIRDLGEKIAVNAATGSAGVTLPLPVSTNRAGFTPELQLTYDSSSGNGSFGFGWSLGTPSITRKTDKGLPQYRDGDESDVFLIAGADDLVPVLDISGTRSSRSRSVWGKTYTIWNYRPRIEGLFARVERWVEANTGLTHWRSISRDNVITLLGHDTNSRVANAKDPTKIFAWRISRSWDDKGNLAVYTYAREDSAGITLGLAHEENRSAGTRGTQTYLTMIQYGNISPYFPDMTAAVEPALPSTFMFSVLLDYGDHTASPPTPQVDAAWPARPDPFSNYRAGFEIRTYRRVQRVLMFNDFPNEVTAGAACLVHSLDLVYSDQQAPADPRNPIYTFLVSATQTGYRNDPTGLVIRSMPPSTFGYSQPQLQSAVLRLDRDSLDNLPEGIDGGRFRWIDLNGEGLAGILTASKGAWYYKRNLGANNLIVQPDGSRIARARFGPMQPLATLPAQMSLEAGQQLLDLAGSGRPDVVTLAEPDAGFYRHTVDDDFEPLQRFAALPQLDWTDPNIRFIDLTGDGLADILLTEDGLFTFYESLGETGYGLAQLVRTPWDEEVGPKLVLFDGTNTIFIADMSGDGLNDIVRVRNGEACYWPNIGYGRFGAKVTTDRAPRFDNEEAFEPHRIRLADIDGTGLADLLYIGQDGVRVWFNQSGNAWSAPTLLAAFPAADTLHSVEVLDLLGTGTACLVWSSPSPPDVSAPLLYVDLMGGQKPHLLISQTNGLGGQTRIAYEPSTQFYLADQQAGRPWVTRLPFPVHVVTRHETIDWIGRNRTVTRYAYHHGYFDGYEREFRGFGMVEQWDTEEYRTDTAFDDGDIKNWDQQSWSPPILTRTWHHTGAFQQAGAISQQYLSEYWIEPALRPLSRAPDAAAMRLPDMVLPAGLDPYEIQEAYRALKGHVLRVEVYAEDASASAANPYSVAESNFTITRLQPTGGNLHAVFLVAPRESLTFYYERAAADPRVSHAITLQTDFYGNAMRSVEIGYARRTPYAPPEPTLSAATQGMLAYDQTRLHVHATEHLYTNAIDDLAQWPDAYRIPQAAGIDDAEITGVVPSVKGTGVTNLFSFSEIGGIWQSAWSGANDIPYEAIPAADVDGAGTPAASLTRRWFRRSRILYRSDDLTALLAAEQVQPRALIGESYKAALTPGQVADAFAVVFAPSARAATLAEGGYVQLGGQSEWWMPSGRSYLSPGDADTPAQELANALTQFFLPRRSVDPFGAIERVSYDAYALMVTSVTDGVGNVTTAANDYRVLQPVLVTDGNNNRRAVALDALGQVTATAVMGKSSETLGDLLTGFVIDPDAPALAAFFANPLANAAALLGNATTRLLYDLAAYQRSSGTAQPQPAAIATLARETHVADLTPGTPTPIQYSFAYNDGFARVIQSKARVADGPLAPGNAGVSPRWVGTGWTIFNNKQLPVRRYEPFFSATQGFEFAAQTGVATTILYDAAQRPVATLHPDNSWDKTVVTAWRQDTWDGNDTVLMADPRNDADVGPLFARAIGGGAFTSWYAARITGNFGVTPADSAAEQDAAVKAAVHAATPSVAHADSLGRPCLSVADAGGGNRYASRTALDTESKPLVLFDALGRRAQENFRRLPMPAGGVQYCAGIDMAGNKLYHLNADAGARWSLSNVAGQTIRLWDARSHAFRMIYDPAQRPLRRYVATGGAAEILIALTIYGEGQQAANLCGRVFRHYDMAGFVETSAFDFKGNNLVAKRQLGVAFRAAIDWTALAGLSTAAALDAAAAAGGLVPSGDGGRDLFASATRYDALNRAIQTVTPHNATMQPNVLQSAYDAGGRVLGVDAWLQQAAAPPGLLAPGTADRHLVAEVSYNARGQLLAAGLGNGTTTSYDYDAETFRLRHLTSTRPASFPANQQSVQALTYFYDPVGNVTTIRDDADTQDVIYFNNQRVEPSTAYTYDPVYRLIAASGREHLGQVAAALQPPVQISNDDLSRMNLPQPGDGNAMGVYAESYSYDPAGNLLAMVHQVSAGNWTRSYAYQEASLIDGTATGNRLSATSLPGDPAGGPFSAVYGYDPHGNMTRMPHLPLMMWDEEDRLRATARQVVNAGTPATAWYVYGFDGGRVRKVSDAQAAAGQNAARRSERIYLGPVELYREFAADGATVSLARETLLTALGDQPVAHVQTRTAGNDPGPAQQVRYQFSNRLGSAVLELDDQSAVISYEEYFPFGATSYQAVENTAEVAKRYRYTGKERDTENDFYYHGARYYAPWLGRWTSADPAGLVDGSNLFRYAQNNPIKLGDPTGHLSSEPLDPETVALVTAAMARGMQALGSAAAAAPGAGAVGAAGTPGVAALGAGGGAAVAGSAAAVGIAWAAALVGAMVLTAQIHMQRSASIARYGNPYGLSSEDAAFPVLQVIRRSRTNAETLKQSHIDAPFPVPQEDTTKNKETGINFGRIYVTYTKYNKVTNEFYSGRTSAVIDLDLPWEAQADAAVAARDANHHVDEHDDPADPNFTPARRDKFAVGLAVDYKDRYRDFAYLAIRGREQQLVDSFGQKKADELGVKDFTGGAHTDTGSGTPLTENDDRPVGKDNIFGEIFHLASDVAFKPLAPYTGYRVFTPAPNAGGKTR